MGLSPFLEEGQRKLQGWGRGGWAHSPSHFLEDEREERIERSAEEVGLFDEILLISFHLQWRGKWPIPFRSWEAVGKY